MEFVDSAGINVFYAVLLQQGHCFDAGSKVFAYGHNYQVDVFQWQHAYGGFLGGVDKIDSGDIVLDGFDVALANVGAYYFMAHVGEVAGEVGAIDAQTDYKVTHIDVG